MPNAALYPKLPHDASRPLRFNQALIRFGAALRAALKRHQSAVGVNLALTADNPLLGCLKKSNY